MNHYPIPGIRRKLHTNAARRYLVVSVYDGRPKVETSSDDALTAVRHAKRMRTDFGPGSALLVLDQTTGGAL